MYKSLDVVVPRNQIPTLVKTIQKISDEHSIESMSFGHAGDGNVHVLLFKGGLADEDWDGKIDQAQNDLYSATIRLGGKITAEHGIGLLRKSYLSMNLGVNQVEVLKHLKAAFDPNFFLNPGKIFDLS
jgi:glycolate oxidase